MVKTRLYDEDTTAAWVLHRVVRDTLTAFAPICPSSPTTSRPRVQHLVRGREGLPRSRRRWAWRRQEVGDALRQLTGDLTAFNSLVWSTKREQGIALNQPIEGMDLPASLEAFRPVLTSMHRLA